MKLAFTFDGGKVISHEVFERTFKIGRSSSCRVTVESEGFSREHALIELIDGKLFITDLDSKNGVMINHVRIPKRIKVAYDTRLPLYVGDCFLSIDFSKDLKDPDHLSLETHARVNPNEVFQNINAPRRIVPKMKPVEKKEQTRSFDGKGIFIALFVLIAIFAISMNRDLIKSRDMNAESEK